MWVVEKMKVTNSTKIFVLAIALSLLIPVVFALQTGFLEVKTLCLNGDCRVVWPVGDVSGIFGGGNTIMKACKDIILYSPLHQATGHKIDFNDLSKKDWKDRVCAFHRLNKLSRIYELTYKFNK